MTAINEKKNSPFQQMEDFRLAYRTIPSGYPRIENFHQGTDAELEMLRALSTVGIIPNKTAESVFGISKTVLGFMEKAHKIVQHSLSSKSLKINFYSLGENGAILTNLHNVYRLNYWREYGKSDILKRILFFKMYEKMLADKHAVKIIPSALGTPFIANLIYPNGDTLQVYIAKDSLDDLLTYYKWAKGKELQQRLLIVCEGFEQFEFHERTFKDIPCRFVKEVDLFRRDISELVYYKLNDELEFEISK